MTHRHPAAYLVDQWQPGDSWRFGRTALADIRDAAALEAEVARYNFQFHPVGSMARDRFRAEFRRADHIVTACRIELDRLDAASATYDTATVITGCNCQRCAEAAQVSA